MFYILDAVGRAAVSRSVGRTPTRLHFFMYLLYLDDSGSAGNQTESYFVLGGFSASEFSLH